MISLKEKKAIFLEWVEWRDRKTFMEICREIGRNYRTVKKVIDECTNKLEEMGIDINDIDTIKREIDNIVTQTPYPSRPSKINKKLIKSIKGELRARDKKRNLTDVWIKLKNKHDDAMVSYNVFIKLVKKIENDEL